MKWLLLVPVPVSVACLIAGIWELGGNGGQWLATGVLFVFLSIPGLALAAVDA